ncbi:hypothetical protein NMG60_11017383 [Bertholletia excelsa]
MNEDCSVNIFGRVGIESLLLDIPYVCKTWYKATLNPSCWQRVSLYGCSKSRLEEEYDLRNNSSITSFIKFVVSHSDGLVTDLELPRCCTKEALLYVADACPNLKFLVLPATLLVFEWPIILELFSKWKNLEFLRLKDNTNVRGILGEVVKHCKNFTGLALAETHVGEAEVSAVVNLMPKIKHLDFRGSRIEKVNLIKVLKGCPELEHLDVRNCTGFGEDNEEIIKLGSHLRKFMRDGSMAFDSYSDDDSSDACLDYDSEDATESLII